MTTIQRTISEKLVGYISVFRNTQAIGIYDNQEFWSAINAMESKLKMVKKDDKELKYFVKTILEENVVQIFSDILIDQLPDADKRQGFDLFSSHQQYKITHVTFHALNSLVELSEEIAKTTICHDWKILPSIQKLLEALKENAVKNKLSKDDRQFVTSVLVMLYNLVMHDNAEIIHFVREKGLIHNINPYMACTDALKMFSFLFLLYVSNEKDACTDVEIIKLLVNTTMAAVKHPDKEINGFKSRELLRAIEKLSALDADKEILFDIGVVKNMIDILEDPSDDIEILFSLGILTNIAFADKAGVAESIEKDVKHLMSKVYDNEDLTKAQQGLHWVLIQKMNKPRELMRSYSRQASAIECEKADPGESSGDTSCRASEPKHIMISYQWGSQDKIREVKKVLKQHNFKLWYDEDNMEGDMMDAMAFAVENAYIVLVCYSRKYKLSSNCRMEAQYAARLKRPIVPLRMEDYEPDGWLGLMINTLMYYDFSKGDNNAEMKRLLSILKNKNANSGSFDLSDITIGSIEENIAPMSVQPESVVDGGESKIRSRRSTQERDSIRPDTRFLINWTTEDLNKWFSEIGIDRTVLGVNTGGDVRTLVEMFRNAPSTFYEYMLKNVSLSELTKFIEGSENLLSNR